MKKVVLMLAAVTAISLSVNAGDGKVHIMHNGHMIEVSQSALQAHLNHGDELMVLYQGNWITQSQYNAIISQQSGSGGPNSAGDGSTYI